MKNLSRVEQFALTTAVILFVALALYFASSSGGYDVTGHVLGRDFLNLHLAGGLLAGGEGDVLFSEDAYMAVIHERYGNDYSVHNWSYPPTMFWLARAAAILPYFSALAFWNLLGISIVALAVRALRLGQIWTVLIVLSPAGVLNAVAGQNGFITAALLSFAIIFGQSATVRSSVSWALLTFKPHLGIVALPMLLMRRQWGVILIGAALFAMLIGATLLVWGTEPWYMFFTYTSQQQRLVLETWRGGVEVTVQTGFMQGRQLNLATNQAYLLHGAYAAIGILLSIRARPGLSGDTRDWVSWFVLTTFLVLPYYFLYDLVVFQVMLGLYAKEPSRLCDLSPRWSAFVWGVAWVSPFVGCIVAVVSSVHILPLLLAWLLWKQGGLRQKDRQMVLDAKAESI